MSSITWTKAEMSNLTGKIAIVTGANSGLGYEYVGPTRFGGMRGYPGKVKSDELSYDGILAGRLWQESVEMTGVNY